MHSHLPCVLLTGFEAFGPSLNVSPGLNPSWMAVQTLHDEKIAGARIVAAQLPCTFAGSSEKLGRLLQAHQPTVVISVGQAGGRAAIGLERIAINLNDAPIPDNEGRQPIDQPVVTGGPPAYFSTLPLKAMLHSLQAEGIEAHVSQTAGTYVCNHTFYALMHALAASDEKQDAPAWPNSVRAGFVHVPWLPEQGEPSMPLDTVVQALRLMVEAALQTSSDAMASAGSID
jgi:pyroglutamyl-peptidase